MARRKKFPAWGPLGDGRPIERLFSQELCSREPRYAEWAEMDAKAEQFRRMCRVKEHYGIAGERGWRPWYELALALASKIDDSLMIVDLPPRPTHKTAKRWAGVEGKVFVEEIAAMRGQVVDQDATMDTLIKKHQELFPRYRDMDFDSLKARYYDAVRHHGDPAARVRTGKNTKPRPK